MLVVASEGRSLVIHYLVVITKDIFAMFTAECVITTDLSSVNASISWRRLSLGSHPAFKWSVCHQETAHFIVLYINNTHSFNCIYVCHAALYDYRTRRLSQDLSLEQPFSSLHPPSFHWYWTSSYRLLVVWNTLLLLLHDQIDTYYVNRLSDIVRLIVSKTSCEGNVLPYMFLQVCV